MQEKKILRVFCQNIKEKIFIERKNKQEKKN
jgi:hypothetical protein